MNNDYNNGENFTPEENDNPQSAPDRQGNAGPEQQGNAGFGRQGNNQSSSTPPPIRINHYSPMNSPLRDTGTTSQILGIIGLVTSVLCCCIPVVGLVLGILALVYSSRSTTANGFTTSAAMVGKVCGIIAIVLCAVIIVLDILSMTTGFLQTFMDSYTEAVENAMNPS